MNKTTSYSKELNNISPKKWGDYLKEHSGLPGPRANIELAKAFSRTATLMDFKRYARLDEDEAPENTPEVFLVFCGILGIGEYLAQEHDGGLLRQLRNLANDRRWRVRESVAMALQTIGRKNIDRLINYAESWIKGTLLEQRAVVAALCEPDLLHDPGVIDRVFEMLDWATASIIAYDDEQDEDYEILSKALSYCWSVATTAKPEKGKRKIERWIKEQHPIVNRIMRKNLSKKRLKEVDEQWAEYWLEKLKD